MKPIAIYDGNNRKRLCYLQNAFNISYNKQPTSLWTAEFSLPYEDTKNEYCKSMNLVEIWDIDSSNENKYIGLFRIMPQNSNLSLTEGIITYVLEHVLSTLMDDLMVGWEEIGNKGVYTRNVLSYILEKQTVNRWVLGDCDYSHEYLYGWQDENLLSALFSVTNCFEDDEYRWEFDTKKYPWTISLKRISEIPVVDIRYRKNINGIKKNIDPTNLTTRLYCYGYGDSDNKLNIKSVNDDKPYLESKNISKYGVISRTWTDERYTVEESLLQAGKTMLSALEEPIINYDIDIATVREVANLEVGDMVRVVDDEEDIFTRVVEISKDDVSGQPYIGKVILANKNTDISQSIADLADRHRIATTYSQGAETLFADSLYDNADNSNPAELNFIVPDNAVHINDILFSAKLTNFRAYSKATQGGGETATSTNSGGGNSTTSEASGQSETTSDNGGYIRKTSGNGGGSTPTSESFEMGVELLENSSANDENRTNHNHGISRGVELITDVRTEYDDAGNVTGVGTSYVTWSPSGAHTHGSHNHRVVIPEHSHVIEVGSHMHKVKVPSHSHLVNIPSHYHNFRIPDHIHDIEYGIYKGSRADSMSIYVDDTLVGHFKSYIDNINLIPYMSKNTNGQVKRGRHTIKIVPNKLTRVECTIQIRLFTNSRGSGQY